MNSKKEFNEQWTDQRRHNKAQSNTLVDLENKTNEVGEKSRDLRRWLRRLEMDLSRKKNNTGDDATAQYS